MKLLFCPVCMDLFKLRSEKRFCSCGASAAHYVDDVQAMYYGEAIPVGISNDGFQRAFWNRNKNHDQLNFGAWIIGDSPQIIRVK
jgi:hypothetical protein